MATLTDRALMQDVNLTTGRVAGTMWAQTGEHRSKTPVVTSFEGEIVDNANHTFLTSKWGASRKVDMKHWGMFAGFQALQPEVKQHAGRYAVFSIDAARREAGSSRVQVRCC